MSELRISVLPNHGSYGVDEYRLAEYLNDTLSEQVDDWQAFLAAVHALDKLFHQYPAHPTAPELQKAVDQFVEAFYAECEEQLMNLLLDPEKREERVKYLGEQHAEAWSTYPQTWCFGVIEAPQS